MYAKFGLRKNKLVIKTYKAFPRVFYKETSIQLYAVQCLKLAVLFEMTNMIYNSILRYEKNPLFK